MTLKPILEFGKVLADKKVLSILATALVVFALLDTTMNPALAGNYFVTFLLLFVLAMLILFMVKIN
jgi:hypothetical protein